MSISCYGIGAAAAWVYAKTLELSGSFLGEKACLAGVRKRPRPSWNGSKYPEYNPEEAHPEFNGAAANPVPLIDFEEDARSNECPHCLAEHSAQIQTHLHARRVLCVCRH